MGELKKTVIILMIICFICTSLSFTAFAAPSVTEGTYVICTRLDNNLVLDVYNCGTANGTNIQIYGFNDGANQKFDIYHIRSKWYKIISNASGKALDVAGGKKGNEVNVQLYEDNESDAQLWEFIDAGDGYYYIKNKLGYYLDVYNNQAVNEANVQVYQLNHGNNQQWRLRKGVEESCIISSALNYNSVLDVYAGNSANGTNIQIYDYNGGDNQKFYLVHAGNGWYVILNVMSLKALDVAGGIKGSEVNVQLYDLNWSDAQLWTFIDAGNGCYYIKNKLGYYLDVYNNQTANETNVQVYEKNNGQNQKWKIEKIGTKDYYEKTEDSVNVVVEYNVDTVSSWMDAVEKKERELVFGGQLVTPASGKEYYSGNIIVKKTVLELKTISTQMSINTPGYYQTVIMRLPSKVQYTLHKHNFKRGYGSSWYYAGDSIALVQTCSCGYRGESFWEIPSPIDPNDKVTINPGWKTLWRPKFYN